MLMPNLGDLDDRRLRYSPLISRPIDGVSLMRESRRWVANHLPLAQLQRDADNLLGELAIDRYFRAQVIAIGLYPKRRQGETRKKRQLVHPCLRSQEPKASFAKFSKSGRIKRHFHENPSA